MKTTSFANIHEIHEIHKIPKNKKILEMGVLDEKVHDLSRVRDLKVRDLSRVDCMWCMQEYALSECEDVLPSQGFRESFSSLDISLHHAVWPFGVLLQ